MLPLNKSKDGKYLVPASAKILCKIPPIKWPATFPFFHSSHSVTGFIIPGASALVKNFKKN